MTTAIIAPDQDVVVSEIQIAAPPERVFQALTDAPQLRRWFTNPSCPIHLWEMDARPGGRYRYTTEKGTVVVNNVSEFECHGEILRIRTSPPARLYLDRQLARRQIAPHRCALGARAQVRRRK
jgi:uncharacterized protein YndB with AHSA1/START domain